MRLPWFTRRPPPPPPPPVEDASPEAQLMRACFDCDTAAQALAQALAARREALVRLVAVTPLGGKANINLLFSPSASWRALSFHGVGPHLDLPHQMAAHRSSFTHQASAAISATAYARSQARQVLAALTDTAQADPATEEVPA
jgi:hypothetical protein